jgi:hypothetical protein
VSVAGLMNGGFADVSTAARDFVEWVEDRVADFTPFDWVLLALAAFALWWIFASVRAVTRLGPLEVEPLEQDGEVKDQAEVKGLTSGLREHLAHSGLAPPAEVPASTPQTDLISAIEASNIPQGAWIAKVLEMLPKPPRPIRYRVSGTLIGKPDSGECGISFWLRPSRSGSELLATIENKQSHAEAVECAAAMIFVHISGDAVYVFPSWARWRKVAAFEADRDGLLAREEGRLDVARLAFEIARREEPRNLLPRMQLASLAEREAALPGCIRPERVRAGALAAYIEAATERPDVVEARYRSSILCSELAAWWAASGDEEAARQQVAEAVGMAGSSSEKVELTLRTLAEGEAETVHQMLRRPYVLLRKGRLRNRYEPRGLRRREMKRAACITTHCLEVRRYTDARAFGLRAAAKLALRRLSVRFWHLIPGASRGWQAHYNAGCFYALLHEREERRKATKRQRWITRRLRRRRSLRWILRILRLRKPYRIARMRRLRLRAYKHLTLASEEARERLDAQWLAKGDPDLESLRADPEDEWTLLLRRHSGVPRGMPELRRLPDPAWGDPARRRNGWIAATLALLVPSAVQAPDLDAFALVTLVAAGLTAIRASLAHREAGRLDATEA